MVENNNQDIIAVNEVELASRWSRLFASIFDGLLMSSVGIVIMYFTGDMDRVFNEENISTYESIFYTMVGLATFYILNINLLIANGQTIGKKFFKIKIVDLNNNIPTKENLMYRYAAYFIPTYIPIIGILYAYANALFIFGKQKRCIHDYAGDTRVVKCEIEKELEENYQQRTNNPKKKEPEQNDHPRTKDLFEDD